MDFGGLDEEMLYMLNETPAVSVSLSLSLASPWYRMIANVIFEILEPLLFENIVFIESLSLSFEKR